MRDKAGNNAPLHRVGALCGQAGGVLGVVLMVDTVNMMKLVVPVVVFCPAGRLVFPAGSLTGPYLLQRTSPPMGC
jgi:hypothetical protein